MSKMFPNRTRFNNLQKLLSSSRKVLESDQGSIQWNFSSSNSQQHLKFNLIWV